jgi:hypothetical protein
MWLTSLLVAFLVLLCVAAVLFWKAGKAWANADICIRNEQPLSAEILTQNSGFTTYELSGDPENRNRHQPVEEPTVPAADNEVEKMIIERKKERSERSAGFCPKCGQPIQQSDQYCPGCGAKVGK